MADQRKLGPFDTTIWDFNGTLIDDVDLAVRAVNVVLGRRDLPTIDVDQHRRAFGHPVGGYYAALGIDLAREDLSALSDEFHEEYLSGVDACGPIDDALELLSACRDRGCRQFVLSAAEQSMLESWVSMLGIERFLDGVYGLGDRLAATKVTRGQELARVHEICPASTLLIGDTDHDVEVASALGCRPVVVAQGHQSLERLEETGEHIWLCFREVRDALR